jgi:triphosphoribosyl-dephospho-CoA synthase
MVAEQFMTSAAVSVDALVERGAPVGKRIEQAIKATRPAVGCNTNLGIVLLCAPLAFAAESAPPTSAALRAQLHLTLAQLTIDDARAAYRAIALANPGGLGAAPQHDVRDIASIDLRAAMALAAQRDLVARQYSNEFTDVFERGVPPFIQFAADPALAMLASYLAFLAAEPDSHIVRKHGVALAHSVTAEAATWLATWSASHVPPRADALAAWDERLKNTGLNPGTSADLAVASAFIAAMLDPRLSEVAVAGLAWNVLNTPPTLTRLSG